MSLIASVLDWSRSPASAGLPEVMIGPFREKCPDGFKSLQAGPCHLGLGHLTVGGRGAGDAGPVIIGDLAVLVDGRLDPIAEIEGAGERLTAESLVAAGYARWGTDVFRRLRGEFAILIWDERNQVLVAARDSMGVRPLYYAMTDSRVFFASDPEQILVCRVIDPEPDDAMVMNYLIWDIHDVERSFFRHIRRLAPGQCLVVDGRASVISSFQTPEIAELGSSDREEIWGEFRRIFSEGLAARIQSSHPVVAQLSGGLDSSSIVCAADRLLSEQPGLCPSLIAAAAVFPGMSCDEDDFIRAVERHVRVPVERWHGARGSSDELDDVSVALPGSRYSLNAGTEGDMELATRVGARVVLSGVGGDQIGVADGGLQDAVSEGRWRDSGAILFGRGNPLAASRRQFTWRLLKTLAPEWLRDMRRSRRPARLAPSWVASDFARKMPHRGKPIAPEVLRTEIHRRRWLDLTAEWHALTLEYSQHQAIRHGVEFRFPFLNVNLISLMLAIPARLWPPPWLNERLHRGIFHDWLPPEIVRRRTKANFSSTLMLRVRRHLTAIRDLFWLPGWRSTRYVERAAAQRVLREFEETPQPTFYLSYAVWSIATLEAWLRKTLMYAPHPDVASSRGV